MNYILKTSNLEAQFKDNLRIEMTLILKDFIYNSRIESSLNSLKNTRESHHKPERFWRPSKTDPLKQNTNILLGNF